MNINQMKSAIAKFRKADLSVIKDEQLRNKAKKLQGKEKGFTLLELLVVITLIAILATGALIAYEDVGEAAEAASAGNAAATIDRAIRTYRAVENVYPNQWDNLVDEDGNRLTFAASAMDTFLASWDVTTSASANAIISEMFEESGIEELQVESNKNLLLSRSCEIDTKPELEIYADDVKCAHGSTVGQIDEQHLFFLRARGLDETAARSLLTYAFAVDVLQRIKSAPMRQALSNVIEKRLPKGA